MPAKCNCWCRSTEATSVPNNWTKSTFVKLLSKYCTINKILIKRRKIWWRIWNTIKKTKIKTKHFKRINITIAINKNVKPPKQPADNPLWHCFYFCCASAQWYQSSRRYAYINCLTSLIPPVVLAAQVFSSSLHINRHTYSDLMSTRALIFQLTLLNLKKITVYCWFFRQRSRSACFAPWKLLYKLSTRTAAQPFNGEQSRKSLMKVNECGCHLNWLLRYSVVVKKK